MQWVDQYLQLFAYDNWANDQILVCLQKHLNFPEVDQAIAYYTHIAGTQEVWYARIQSGSPEDLQVWPDYGLSVAQQKLKTYTEKWRLLITKNRSDLNQPIAYQNTNNEPFETPLSDILHHLIIHGQHHRAQIAQLLRNAKIVPPGTDFIFFSRSN